MDNGLQGRSKPASTTDTTLITATTPIVVTLNILNTNGGSADEATVSVIPSGASAGQEHMIERGTEMAAKAVIERTGIVLGTGDAIVVQSANGHLSFNVWGVEL